MGRIKLIKRLLASAAVVTVLAGGLATLSPMALAAVSEKSAKYFEKAQSYVEKGNVSAAMIELKNAIRSDADNVDARFELAKLYIARNDLPGAEKELRAAMSRGFSEDKALPMLADVLLLQGKNQQVIKELEAVSLEGAAQADLDVRRAQAHFALEQNAEARQALGEARQLNPDLPQLHVVESWLLQREKKLKEAEAEIDKALAVADKNLEVLLQKAELRRLQGDAEGAVAFATRAIDANPYDSRPRMTRSIANAQLGNVEAALGDAETMIERNARNPLAAFVKAWALAQKGETEAALAAIEQGVGGDNFMPGVYLEATLHLQAGQLEQARAKIDRYLVHNPGSKSGLVTSATIAHRAGDYEKAVSILGPLYATDPSDVQIVAMLASAYEESGQGDKAAALFDQATALAPEDENLQFLSARAKITQGNVEGGMDTLENMADTAAGGIKALTVLYLMHLQQKDYDKADEALSQLEEKGGNTKETENFRGALSFAQGDVAGAEEHLNRALTLDDTYPAARLSLARLLRSKGDYKGAKAQYETLLSQREGYLPAYAGLIQLARDAGKEKEVERLYRQAVKSNPNSDAARLRLIDYFLKSTQADKALSEAKDFANAQPENPVALDALGRAQMAAGQPKDAVGTYNILSNLVTGDAEIYYRLARAKDAAEDYTGAIFALDQVLSLDPSREQVRRTRIALEDKVHGPESAIAVARKLYSDADTSVASRLALGVQLANYGELEEGLSLIRSAHDEVPGPGSALALALVYDRLGRQAEGTAALEHYVAVNPESLNVRIALFSRYLSEGQFDKALKEGEYSYQKAPDSVIVLNNLAWLYGEQGRGDEAKALGKKAVELAPQSGDVADTYGWILYNLGEMDAAEEVLGKALALRPDSRSIAYHYAAAAAKAGKTDKAVEVLTEILSEDAAFPERESAKALLDELKS